MTTDRLLVKPGELQAKASEVQTERGKIANQLSTALSEIQSLSATWQSPAADAYRIQFEKQNNELQNILAMLDRHVRDLTASAETFSTGEQSLTAKNEALPVVNITQ
jgi:WXG100 family type VII secretion target